jgi:hypothetical protein
MPTAPSRHAASGVAEQGRKMNAVRVRSPFELGPRRKQLIGKIIDEFPVLP